MRRSNGLTIVETIVALAILGVVLSFVVPSFVTNLQISSRTELRGTAVAVAQQVLEGLRQVDPTTLPSTGNSAPQSITVQGRTFQAVTTYCAQASFCSASARHVRVAVSYNGSQLYVAETVYTKLQ